MIKDYAKIKAEILRRLSFCEKEVLRLKKILLVSKEKFLKGEVNEEEHNLISDTETDGKTLNGWINYYEEYRKKCLEELRKIEKIENIYFIKRKIFLILLFLTIFILGFIQYLDKLEIVSFSPKVESFQENINLEIENNSEYIWEMKNIGELKSFKITGSMESSEGGEVKIFLEDKLILDSNNVKSLNGGITAAVVIDIDQDGRLIEENKTSVKVENTTEINNQTLLNETTTEEKKIKKVFRDACEETCNLEKANFNKSSYKLRFEIKKANLKISSLNYEVVSLNIANTSQIEFNESKIYNESLIQLPGSVDAKVRWVKTLNFEKPVNIKDISLEIPKEADLNEIVLDYDVEDYFNKIKNYTYYNSSNIQYIFTTGQINKRITGVDSVFEKDMAQQIIIDYTTPAPNKFEEETSRGKIVKISDPSNFSYKNLKANTNIKEVLNVGQENRIKIYWNEEKRFIDFTAKDVDENGKIDYVEWIVPHLSEQTFEIILISKADHLSENKTFISDIYDSVKELDENWSETIKEEEYVRATFEKKLTNKNDITIYPRVLEGNPRIEVYEFNKTNKIAEFPAVNSNSYNKIFLSSLLDEQDTFDLRVVDGSIEIDHIIDPTQTGINILYFNSTGTVSPCPTTSRQLNEIPSNSPIYTWPGQFNTNQPGNSDSGQFLPGTANKANTTTATEIANSAQTSRNSASFGQGWIYDKDLSGYTIEKGNFTFNLTLMGGQGTNANSERLFARVSVVTCSGGNFVLVKDLTKRNCVGGASCSGGQAGWRASEGARFTHPGVNAMANIKVNVSTNETFTFSAGQKILIEIGFGDAQSATFRTIGFKYNFSDSFVITPPIRGMNLPYAKLNSPPNSSVFIEEDLNITLNASIFDDNLGDNVDVRIYGIGYNLTNNFYKNGLIYQKFGVLNGTAITYNWTAPVVIPDPSTKLLYHFDNNSQFGENSTFVFDFSGNGNNGSVSNGTIFGVNNGKFAGAFYFDGINNNSVEGSNLGYKDFPFTLSAWVNYTGASKGTIIENAATGVSVDYHGLRINASGNPEIYTRSGFQSETVNGSSIDVSNAWHLITGVFANDTDKRLYVDGVNVVNITSSETCCGLGDPTKIFIGKGGISFLELFNGSIDEPAFWNRSLSDAEVKNLHRLKGGKYYWKVNLTDSFGNSNESETQQFNVTQIQTNSAPRVSFISNIGSITPNEESVKKVKFNITVEDLNGFNDIDINSVKANFSRSGEITRKNDSCSLISGEDTINSRNFACAIEMWYFDGPGDWNVSVSASDLTGSVGTNNTAFFQYDVLYAIKISSDQMLFDVLTGKNNITASSPTFINNTGNYNVSLNGLKIFAIDLQGETYNESYLGVGNFSVGVNTSLEKPECDSTRLINGSDVNISGAILSRGNITLNYGNETSGQETIYFCLSAVPQNLVTQIYSTKLGGSWIIKVLLVSLHVKRKKKKKRFVEDNLVKTIGLMSQELKEKYDLSKKEIVDIVLLELEKKNNLVNQNLKSIDFEKIPTGIFMKDIGALEVVVKYLKENKGKSYHEIAKMLKRDDRTIWTSYHKAVKKIKKKIEANESDAYIPLSIFGEKNLTVLETAVKYLKEKDYRYTEIAKMLKRDVRNMQSIYIRASKKCKKS
ncbi:MAG: LamG domain-containing protein [Nanoarchaeota archaeon]